MPKFHTNVNGMQGTGEPIVPQGAIPVEDGKEPAKKTGGTFSGMQVTEHVMEQIKQGSASDFFSFEPSKDDPGKYDMVPKLPEYGCDGPGKPVFKLRENQNRLMKGFAKKCFKEDGTLDVEAGGKFISEYYARFGLSPGYNFAPYCPEMPLETDKKVLQEAALDWLCGELEIPNEEKAGFKNYGRAVLDFAPVVSETHKTGDPEFRPDGRAAAFLDGMNGLGKSNFLDLFASNLSHCLEVQEMEKIRAGQPKENGKEDIFDRNIRQYHEAVEELRSYANIDPKTEMKIMVPTECSGSSVMGVRFTNLANNANIALGKGSKEIVNDSFKISILNKLSADLNGPTVVEKKLQELEEKKPTLEEAEYNRQKQQLDAELEKAQKAREEILKKQEGHTTSTKWDMHHAPVVGSFTDDEGKKHYLTIEAFAPESDTYMEHPAITNGVSIGVYSDIDDFVDYYYKDNPYTEKNPETDAYYKLRGELKDKGSTLVKDMDTIVEKVPGLKDKYDYFEPLKGEYSDLYKQGTAEVDRQIDEDLKGKKWDDNYQAHTSDNSIRYKPKMGIPSQFNTDYQEELSGLIREATLKATGVPDEYREAYDHFLSTCEGILRKTVNYGKAYLAHTYMRKMVQGDTEKDTDIRNVMRINENGQSMFHDDEEDILEGTVQEMSNAIKKMMSGKPYRLKEDAKLNGAALRLYFQKNNINPEDFEKFVNDISSSMRPVIEARMDIQVAFPEIADSFMQKDVWHLDAREREFATQNMDVTLKSVFSGEQMEEIASAGMDIYDCIYIDGKSANELFGNKYTSLQGDADEFKKSDLLQKILNGCQMEFARPDGKGSFDIVQLNAYSDVPVIENGLSRYRFAGQAKTDFSIDIRAHQNALRNGEIKKEDVYSPKFEIGTKVDELLFKQMAGFNEWVGNIKGKGGKMDPGVKIAYDETGYNLGREIVSKLTGINAGNDMAKGDFRSISAALSQICVDGIPYTFTLEDGINKDNYKEVLGKFAEKFSAQFDEKKIAPIQKIGVLKEGKLNAITYDPPEPVPPKTKKHWYSSNAVKEARANEERAYADQQRRVDLWKERNSDAVKNAVAQDKIRQNLLEYDVELSTNGGKDKVQVRRRISFDELLEKEAKNKQKSKNNTQKTVQKNVQQKNKSAELF